MHPVIKAINFIEQKINEPITTHDVAKAAGYSVYHFSRTFLIVVGQTIKEYIRKRRLTIAAGKLLSAAEVRIIDLAFDCQFESQEAFTRAFKKMFQATPGEYRKFTDPMQFLFQERFSIDNLNHLKWGVTMEPVIKQKDEFLVVGMEEEYTHKTSCNIPQLWDQFVPLIDKIPNRKGQHYFGVCEGNPKDINDENFMYMACVEVDNLDEVPQGLIEKVIPKSEYAVFTHKGSLDKLGETTNYIWGSWLPKCGYKYGAIDFELYDERFNPETMDGELDIWVPILKREN
ncbi:MAG: AraC family transcriptional regulator [Bacteriovoracaceae bacterium]|nr:AraC family transcriptional regulator [Bacteriovoracaceae bacterium]